MKKYQKLKWQDRVCQKTLFKWVPEWVTPFMLTWSRVFMIPLIVLLWEIDYFAIAIIVFLIASFTDLLDGSLARVRHKVTKMGMLQDPIADKIFIGFLLFFWVSKYLDSDLAWFIIVLEIFIIGLASFRLSFGEMVYANFFGKFKMVFQVLGVLLLMLAVYFQVENLYISVHYCLYASIVFAFLSIFYEFYGLFRRKI